MTDIAYYNEHDSYVAQWLRNLIVAGLLPFGIVDERSIEDVRPADLIGFTQCHFFAGLGGWPLALRRAGWPDNRPVWTGSCPCQPFSTAGKGTGFADERHLWPSWLHLISECKPDTIFGEQVASKDADTWVDLVHTDLEALGHTFGTVPFPSAGVGAPHIRDRLYWVADWGREFPQSGEGSRRSRFARMREINRLDDAIRTRLERFAGDDGATGRQRSNRSITPPSGLGGVANGDGLGTQRTGRKEFVANADLASSRLGHPDVPQPFGVRTSSREQPIHDERDVTVRESEGTGPTNGFWRNADWLYCRDESWRPVEPGTFPLADGILNRMGKLRAYGNAVNAVQAQIFIESYLSA